MLADSVRERSNVSGQLVTVSSEEETTDEKTTEFVSAQGDLERARRSPTEVNLKARLCVADLVALVVAAAMAFGVQALVRPVPATISYQHGALLVASLPFFAFGAYINRLYLARANERPSEEWRNIIRTVGVSIAGMVALAFVVQFSALSRLWVVALACAVTATLVVEREFARRIFNRMRWDGRIVRRIIIVGTDSHAIGLLHTFERRPDLGYEVVGFVGDEDIGERAGVHRLGGYDEILDVLDEQGACGVVVAPYSVDAEVSNRITRSLTDAGYHVAISSSLHDIDVVRIRTQDVDGRALLYIEPIIRTGWRGHAKRVFDLVAASAALVLAAPVIAVSAILIKLDSPGPVIFRQQRVGQDGRVFELMKMRTMVVDAEARKAELMERNEMDGPLFKIEHDPRITRLGRYLRKLSIDELPQLIAVFKGDMSMVGPRPALPDEVEQWPADVRDRLRVLPGITGMWQVSGRSGTTFDEYKRLDMYYVDNWSLVHDIRICAKTFGVVLTAKGAS